MLDRDFGDIYDKICNLCRENKLEFSFECVKFPVVARLKPDLKQTNQLTFDEEKEKTNFVNGEIKFTFGDELTMTVLNDFKIEDDVLNKIKSMTKKLHYIYLQTYFKKKTA
jgi:hypothetical protein